MRKSYPLTLLNMTCNYGYCRYNDIKMRLLEWSLIQKTECPYKKEKVRRTKEQRSITQTRAT